MSNMELLQAYLVSIGIYFVVILAMLEVFADKIANNGWLDGLDMEDDENPYPSLFLICTIPFVRLWQCITVLIMAFITKEDFEKYE